MSIVDTIFARKELQDAPPILIDIGASGALFGAWKEIAQYSICLAFDPDLREMKHVSAGASPYKELFVHNSIVSAEENNQSDFYLTKSPYCSSTLKPSITAGFGHSPLFEIENKIILKAETLLKALREHNLTRVDWFKTDSQGTDVRLFGSLGEELITKTLAVDLEPGIINAYEGEDKTLSALTLMDKRNFWMTEMKVMPVKKIPENAENLTEKTRSSLIDGSAGSPGWTELSYLNDGKNNSLGLREYLLLWVFATNKGQHGFAYDIAMRGTARFHDPLFTLLVSESEQAAGKIASRRARSTKWLRRMGPIRKPLVSFYKKIKKII